MNQNKLILTLLWAAGLTLVMFIVSDLSISFINQYKKKYQSIRISYIDSVVKAHSVLKASLSKIASDPKVTSELKKKSYHVLNRQLSTYLRFGELDNIHIFNKRCQLLTAVNIVKKYSFDCLRINQEGMINPIDEEKSTLSVSNKLFFNGDNYYIVAHVQLSSSWVKSQKILSNLFLENDLAISSYPPTSEHRSLFSHQASAINSQYQKLLWISDPVYSLFYFLFSKKNAIVNIFYYPLLLMVAIIFLALIFLIKKQLHIQKKLKKELMEWSDQLKFKSYFDLCYDFNQTHLLKTKNTKDYVKSNVTKILMTSLSKIKDLEKKRLLSNENINNVVMNKKELKEINSYASLAFQFRQCGSKVLSILESIESSNQDISDIISSATRQECKNILEQSKNWEEKIKGQGRRTFIRSFSETVNLESSKSSLEYQIENVVYAMERIEAKLSACTLKSLEINTDLLSCLSPIKTWYQHVAPYEQNETVTLSDCLHDLNNIMRFETGSSRINFIIKNAEHEYLPSFVPPHIWRSGLYHLLKAITVYLDHSKEVTCFVNWSHKESKNTFSFSILEDSQMVVSKEKKSVSKEQWYYAHKLFSDYDVACDRLISADQTKLLALKWEKSLEPEKEHEARLI